MTMGGNNRRGWTLAVLLALGTAVLVCWSALSTPGAVVGSWQHPDNLSNHWLLVWVGERLLGGESLLHNDRYYWPVGDAPLLAGNGMEGLTYLPLHLLWGWPFAAVIWSAIAVAFNGLAAGALARSAGAGWGGSWLAVAVVGWHPYVPHELDMGHFSQADLGWLLLSLAALTRLIRGGPTWWGAVAGACAAVAAALYWYHGVFFGLMALALVAAGGWRAWRGLLLGAAVGAVLIAPWGWISLDLLAEVPGVGEDAIFPHPHARNAILEPGLPFGAQGTWQQARVLPLVVPVLALLGLGRERCGWALIVGLGVLLGLGPETPLYEVVYGWSAPMRRFWWPYRHGVLLLIGASTLAALAIDRLPASNLVGLVLALSVPGQLWLTGDLAQLAISQGELPPAVYAELAELPDGVVLEAPLAPEASIATTMVAYQMWHGKTLLNGHAPWVRRVRPVAWDAFIDANPFLRAITRWERGRGVAEVSTEGLAELRSQGLRWLVINPEHFHSRLKQLYRGWRNIGARLGGHPVLSADGLEVYDLSARPEVEVLELPAFRWPAKFPTSGPEHTPPGNALPSLIWHYDEEAP